jgi:hypothetical protein
MYTFPHFTDIIYMVTTRSSNKSLMNLKDWSTVIYKLIITYKITISYILTVSVLHIDFYLYIIVATDMSKWCNLAVTYTLFA